MPKTPTPTTPTDNAALAQPPTTPSPTEPAPFWYLDRGPGLDQGRLDGPLPAKEG